jgi:hypothetical protein
VKPVATQVAKNESKRLPNHVYIDRLAGKDIAPVVASRRVVRP